MNILVQITFLEMFLLIMVSFCVLKKPLYHGGALAILISVFAYWLQEKSALFPFDVIKGSEIVNTAFMRAAVYKPELGEAYVAVLDDNVPIPYHHSSQVLIKVEAAAINPVDYKFNTALIPFVRFFLRKIPGVDVSGTVLSVGKSEKCKEFKKYDQVFGTAPGSLAQYTILSCETMTKLPNRLSHNEAAALPVAFLTSLESFNIAGFSYSSQKYEELSSSMNPIEKRVSFEAVPVEIKNKLLQNYQDSIEKFNSNAKRTMIVVGGSGGCGLFGLKLAKLFGFNEIISINSPKNNEMVKKHGANKVVNYRNDAELVAFVQEYQNKVDFIYDTVTDQDSEYDYFHKLSGVLKDSNSKYVAINGRGHNFLWYSLLKPNLRIFFDKLEFSLGTEYNLADKIFPINEYSLLLLSPRKFLFDQTKAIFDLEDSEKFLKTIEIASVIKLENTADVVSAYMKLKTHRTVGKIVVLP